MPQKSTVTKHILASFNNKDGRLPPHAIEGVCLKYSEVRAYNAAYCKEGKKKKEGRKGEGIYTSPSYHTVGSTQLQEDRSVTPLGVMLFIIIIITITIVIDSVPKNATLIKTGQVLIVTTQAANFLHINTSDNFF